jgi:hypothetical protein
LKDPEYRGLFFLARGCGAKNSFVVKKETTSEVGWGVVVDSEGDIGILCLNESGVVNNLEI